MSAVELKVNPRTSQYERNKNITHEWRQMKCKPGQAAAKSKFLGSMLEIASISDSVDILSILRHLLLNLRKFKVVVKDVRFNAMG